MSLFDASVDLNPHQIEAAMFALQSPLSEGVILADEVELGKTIEAGIVLCQRWAERRRRLLVVCPASIRKQWATELIEKFNLPALVMDARAYRDIQSLRAKEVCPHANREMQKGLVEMLTELSRDSSQMRGTISASVSRVRLAASTDDKTRSSFPPRSIKSRASRAKSPEPIRGP